jgi:hypothetical protein
MTQSHPHPSPATESEPREPRGTEAATRRRQKLIKPGIQLRLSGVFAGLSILCLVIQWLLLNRRFEPERATEGSERRPPERSGGNPGAPIALISVGSEA